MYYFITTIQHSTSSAVITLYVTLLIPATSILDEAISCVNNLYLNGSKKGEYDMILYFAAQRYASSI